MADPGSDDALDATGERLIPEVYAGELVLAEHLARYYLASRLVAGRRVLDAASGEGYGTSILATAGAASVVGIDVDPAVVAHARDRYGLEFRDGDVCQLPFPDEEFDFVVSFETIEHVPDPERALDEFARVLRPDGLLMVSTPNASEYLEDNPFHYRELTREEFVTALRARFPEVRHLHQQNFLTSAVLDADRLAQDDPAVRRSLDTRHIASAGPERDLYMVALCGLGRLPPLEADIAVMAEMYEAHKLAQLLREWQARAAEAERVQREWAARAAEAERVQDEWQARAAEAERVQGEWQARATEAERQAAELRATVERIAASLSWRVTKPLRAVRGVRR